MAVPSSSVCKLEYSVRAHDSPIWSLAWLPNIENNNKNSESDILFTGGSDGTIKKWMVNSNNNDYHNNNNNSANLFDDSDNKTDGYSVINNGELKLGLTPITDMKCRSATSDLYLLTTVSVDSIVRVFSYQKSNGQLSLFKQFDMNKKHKVDLNGNIQFLEQYGGCWSSDINLNCSICATGDQFGQIYLWPLLDDSSNTNKSPTPTVLQALVPKVKITKKQNNSNNQTEQYRAPHAMVVSVEFNRKLNPNWLAVSCQQSQRIEVFDIEKKVSLFSRKLTNKNIRDCVWCPGNEAYLCVACDDNFVHVYDMSNSTRKALVASLPGHQSWVTSVDFGKKQFVASVSVDQTMKLWNLENSENKLFQTHNDHTQQIWKVRFNQSKRDKIATVGDDGKLCIYSINV